MATNCSVEEIHLYDIGTVFEVTLYECDTIVPNLNLATEKYIIFKKPDETVVTKTADFKTDGSDGIIQYITIEDDLDQVGTWKIQAHVVFASGSWKSDVDKFKVYDNL